MDKHLEVKNLELATNLLNGIENGIERAITATINKTLAKVKTSIKRKTTEEYNIKSKDIASKLTTIRATFSTLTGTIYAKTPRLGLHKFMSSRSKDGNIFVSVKKSKALKKLKRNPRYEGNPFVTTMSNGHTGIMQRKSKSRYPIKELYTLGIAEMIGSPTVSEYVIESGQSMIEDVMYKEVERILKGFV